MSKYSSIPGNQLIGEKMEIEKKIKIARKLKELEKDIRDLKILTLPENCKKVRYRAKHGHNV